MADTGSRGGAVPRLDTLDVKATVRAVFTSGGWITAGVMAVSGFLAGDATNPNIVPSQAHKVVGIEYCYKANAFTRGVVLVEGRGEVPAYHIQHGFEVIQYVDDPPAPQFNSTALLNGEPVEVTPQFVDCIRAKY